MKVVRYKILYEKGVVSKLSSRFGVTDQTVRNARRTARLNQRSCIKGIWMCATEEANSIKTIVITRLK